MDYPSKNQAPCRDAFNRILDLIREGIPVEAVQICVNESAAHGVSEDVTVSVLEALVEAGFLRANDQ